MCIFFFFLSFPHTQQMYSTTLHKLLESKTQQKKKKRGKRKRNLRQKCTNAEHCVKMPQILARCSNRRASTFFFYGDHLRNLQCADGASSRLFTFSLFFFSSSLLKKQ